MLEELAYLTALGTIHVAYLYLVNLISRTA